MATQLSHNCHVVIVKGEDMIITCPEIKLKVVVSSEKLIIPIRGFPFYRIYVENVKNIKYKFINEKNSLYYSRFIETFDDKYDHDLVKYFKDIQANKEQHQVKLLEGIERKDDPAWKDVEKKEEIKEEKEIEKKEEIIGEIKEEKEIEKKEEINYSYTSIPTTVGEPWRTSRSSKLF